MLSTATRNEPLRRSTNSTVRSISTAGACRTSSSCSTQSLRTTALHVTGHTITSATRTTASRTIGSASTCRTISRGSSSTQSLRTTALHATGHTITPAMRRATARAIAHQSTPFIAHRIVHATAARASAPRATGMPATQTRTDQIGSTPRANLRPGPSVLRAAQQAATQARALAGCIARRSSLARFAAWASPGEHKGIG